MRMLAGSLLVLFVLLALPMSPARAQSVRFPDAAIWHQDISATAEHADSESMLATLQALGGWGNGDRMQIDFSIHVNRIDAGDTVTRMPIVAHAAYDDSHS